MSDRFLLIGSSSEYVRSSWSQRRDRPALALLFCALLGAPGCGSTRRNADSSDSAAASGEGGAGSTSDGTQTSLTASSANSSAGTDTSTLDTSSTDTGSPETTSTGAGGGTTTTTAQDTASSASTSGVGGDTSAGGSAGADTSAGGSAGTDNIEGGFYESFEDGELSPWAPGPEGADAAITDETAAAGSEHSLRVPGDVYYYSGPNIIFEPIQASSVSWWLRFSGAPPGNNGVAHFALSFDDEARYKLVQVWAANDGFLFDTGLGQPIAGEPPEQDTWYHLEMSIDWQTRLATFSVDGAPVVETELVGEGEAITRIDLFTVEDTTSYFDEIAVLP